MIHQEDSAYSHSHINDLLQWKDAQQYQQREKAHGVKSGGNQVHVSISHLPVEPHRKCLTPPASNCANRCEMSTREAHERLITQGFHWGLVTWAPSAEHIPKFHTFRRKAVVQHQPHCLLKKFKHREPLLWVRDWLEQSQNLSSSTSPKGQPCKQAFLGQQSQDCYVNAFFAYHLLQTKYLYPPKFISWSVNLQCDKYLEERASARN